LLQKLPDEIKKPNIISRKKDGPEQRYAKGPKIIKERTD
jgi:hypothetical protein